MPRLGVRLVDVLCLCYYQSLLPSCQFGNTCYVNSVLQALYFCLPFRERVLEHKCAPGEQPETLLASLADLFDQIACSRRKFGVLQPRKFISKVRKENGRYTGPAKRGLGDRISLSP